LDINPMATIGNVVISVFASTKGLSKSLAKAQKSIGAFAKKASKAFIKIGSVISAGFLAKIAAIGTIVATQSKAAKELINVSNAVGVSVKSLTKWTAAAKTVNIESEKMNDILKDTADKIGDFVATGGGEAADVFKRLGFAAKDFIDLDAGESLLKIGKAMDGITSKEQVFLMESLANDASRLLPLLKNGAEAYNKAITAAIKSGNILTRQQAESAASFSKSIATLKNKFSGFSKQITVQLSKPMSLFIDYINQSIEGMGGMEKVAKRFAKSFISGIESIIIAGAELLKFLNNAIILSKELEQAWTFARLAKEFMFGDDSGLRKSLGADISRLEKELRDLEAKNIKLDAGIDKDTKALLTKLMNSVGTGGGEGKSAKTTIDRWARSANSASIETEKLAKAAKAATEALSPKIKTGPSMFDMSSVVKGNDIYKNWAKRVRDASLGGEGTRGIRTIRGSESTSTMKSMQDYIDESPAGKALQEWRNNGDHRPAQITAKDLGLIPDYAQFGGKTYYGDELKKLTSKPKQTITLNMVTDAGEVTGELMGSQEFIDGISRLQNEKMSKTARMAAV